MRLTKLTTCSLKKEMRFGDNIYDSARKLIATVLSEEIQSRKEHLFIITLKKRMLQGVHIIGIGSYNMCVADYKSLVKFALDDDADEVIICHNHPVFVKQQPEEMAIASDLDLMTFFNIFQMFALLGIYCSCGVFGGGTECTTFYFMNAENNDVVKESGWVNKMATQDKNKKKCKMPVPYVKLDDKKIFFSYSKHTPFEDNKQGKKKNEKRK
jgi:hypothetical protein